MGRITKRFVIFYSVILLAWLPVSVTAASIDCLFHEESSSDIQIENFSATSGHEMAFDLSDISFSEPSEVTTSPDSGCATQLIAATLTDLDGLGVISWEKSVYQHRISHRLTAVLLPQDIRPPISI